MHKGHNERLQFKIAVVGGAEASEGTGGGGFHKGEHIKNFIEVWIEEHGEDNPRIHEKMVDKVAFKHIKTDAELYFDVHGEILGMTQSRRSSGQLEWFSESYFYKLWRSRLRTGHLHNKMLPKVSFTDHKRVSSKCFAWRVTDHKRDNDGNGDCLYEAITINGSNNDGPPALATSSDDK